jgi:hypothetical protein
MLIYLRGSEKRFSLELKELGIRIPYRYAKNVLDSIKEMAQAALNEEIRQFDIADIFSKGNEVLSVSRKYFFYDEYDIHCNLLENPVALNSQFIEDNKEKILSSIENFLEEDFLSKREERDIPKAFVSELFFSTYYYSGGVNDRYPEECRNLGYINKKLFFYGLRNRNVIPIGCFDSYGEYEINNQTRRYRDIFKRAVKQGYITESFLEEKISELMVYAEEFSSEEELIFSIRRNGFDKKEFLDKIKVFLNKFEQKIKGDING